MPVQASGVSPACYWFWTNERVENHGNGKGLPQNNPMWAQIVAEINQVNTLGLEASSVHKKTMHPLTLHN